MLWPGPAIVHTGGGEHFEKLIEWGYVDLLFAGNALAVHDIENALFDTSLGVDLETVALTDVARKPDARDQRHPRCRRNHAGRRERFCNSGIMFHCAQEKNSICPRRFDPR